MKVVRGEHVILGAGDRERERLRHGPSPGWTRMAGSGSRQRIDSRVPAQSAPDSSLFQ